MPFSLASYASNKFFMFANLYRMTTYSSPWSYVLVHFFMYCTLIVNLYLFFGTKFKMASATTDVLEKILTQDVILLVRRKSRKRKGVSTQLLSLNGRGGSTTVHTIQ